MVYSSHQSCMLSVAIMLLLSVNISSSLAHLENGSKIKSATLISPVFVLGPGSVVYRLHYNIDFPRGHIFLKGFNAEVIDDAGNSIPLHETYLHHWAIRRYYHRTNASRISARNSGVCQGDILGQFYGVGSETRKTATYVPDPYGIEIGNPAEIPVGYDERWLLDLHAIDTRGVEDRLGCAECRCDLYNTTVDANGNLLSPEYKGGLLCCYDGSQCRLRQGFSGEARRVYLRYTVKWVEWDSSVIPVKIFIFDVTDTGERLDGSSGIGPQNGCQVEYQVKSCKNSNAGCIDVKRTSITMPNGGSVIYGVAHQHTGATGSTLYGQDGRVICTSLPIYGNGKEAGNEAGYVVGMSACYPKPGSVKIVNGEKLVLESNYSSAQMHTGVMGLFHIFIADRTPKETRFLDSITHAYQNMEASLHPWKMIVLLGSALTLAVVGIAAYSWAATGKDDRHKPILT